MTEELIIDESNFSEYFFDVRIHKPQKGQAMSVYRAAAQLCSGQLKKDLIDLLYNKEKAEAATKVMRKLGCATERDSIRVCREIAQDLVNGMSLQEVEEKIYNFTIEVFYYTKVEYVPKDDPHWSIVQLRNLDVFLEK